MNKSLKEPAFGTPSYIKYQKAYELLNQNPEFAKLSKDEQFKAASGKVFSKKEAFYINFEEINFVDVRSCLIICWGINRFSKLYIKQVKKRQKELLNDPEFAKLSDRDQYLNAELLIGE